MSKEITDKLHRIILQTAKYEITIMSSVDNSWFLQVMKGAALTHHVESLTFENLHEAVKHASEKYGLKISLAESDFDDDFIKVDRKYLTSLIREVITYRETVNKISYAVDKTNTPREQRELDLADEITFILRNLDEKLKEED